MVDIGPAVIAAVSGLVGAGIGGTSTYLVARQQIDASRQAARDEADRHAVQRRRELYADFIATASEIVGSWLEVVGRSVDDSIVQSAGEERAEMYSRLHRQSAMVRLTASSTVSGATEDVLAEVRRLQTSARRAHEIGIAAVPDSRWQEHEAGFVSARDRFVEIVRDIRRGEIHNNDKHTGDDDGEEKG